MSGGHATTAGITFQYEVGAWFAVHILCERPPYFLEEATPVRMQLETTSPVDDIVVFSDNGAGWFVNVKTEVAASASTKSPFSSVVDQFVRQVLSGVDVDSGSLPRRSWNHDLDRLVLAVRAGGSSTLVNGLGPVIRRLVDSAGRFGMDMLNTQSERNAFNVFFAQVNFHWQRHTGTIPTEAEIWRLLSCVRILEVDVSGADKAAAIMMLEAIVGSVNAKSAFDVLVAICMDLGKRRSGADLMTFRGELNTRNIAMLALKGFEDDIKKLKSRTQSALSDMSRYAKIDVYGKDNDLVSSIEIKRACIDSLVEGAAAGKSFLVIGEPGAGKSGAMCTAARELMSRDCEVLCLQVDELVGSTSDLLMRNAGLAHPVADILENWRPNRSGVLLIDALDATRGVGAEAGVQALISEVRRKAPHWSIVATIRKFDLRYGTHYQRLFEGQPLSSNFEDKEFIRVAHLNVPQLSSQEIGQVREKWPALDAMVRSAKKPVQELLRAPFNLYLLGRSLSVEHSEMWSARTQLELLEQFWKQRVGNDFVEAEESSATLDVVLEQMLCNRSLSAHAPSVDKGMLPSVKRLLSNGVLYRPTSSRQLKFAHHMLFDFALAKLVFMREGANSIPLALEAHALDVLMVAPASALALAMAWNAESERGGFWTISLSIAGNDALGAFLRTLPAKVAAEQILTLTDIEPLVLALGANSERVKEGAAFLARHILNVLLAGVVSGVPKFGDSDDPWCCIVREFAKVAPRELQWPLNAVLATWSGYGLSFDEAAAIGEASRYMLQDQLLMDGEGNEGVISAAIKGICRTFETAPRESAALIRLLLLPERVSRHGHSELFWLANEFETVADNDAVLGADIFIAAYTAPLPSSDEMTSMGGSRILSLTSNKRQDFEGVLYSLGENLKWFIKSKPEQAARAIRCALDYHLSLEQSLDRVPKSTDVQLDGKVIGLTADLSCMWWSVGASYRDTYAKLVEVLYEVLKDAEPDLYKKLADAFLHGKVFAVIAAVFLRAASAREDGGGHIRELLTFPNLLNFMDTSFDAGQLIAARYNVFSMTEKVAIQEAIVQLDDVRQQEMFVGCLINAGIKQDELIDGLKHLAKTIEELPANTPYFSISSGWGEQDEHWWLREQGVDVSDPAVQELLELSNTIQGKGDAPALTLPQRWSKAIELLLRIQGLPDLNISLKNQVLDAVGDLASQVCQTSVDKPDVNLFKGVRDAIEACLDPLLAPNREVDEEVERQFASSPSWGRPAPRIVGGEALMAYIRQVGDASERDKQLVLQLAQDPAVSVRNAVLSRANLVCLASPELARDLAHIAFESERNEGVLKFFLSCFNQYISQDLAWSSKAVLELDRRLGSVCDGKERADNLRTGVVHTVLRLWITWNISEAGARLSEWANEPLLFSLQIHSLLSDLRELVVFGEPDVSDQRSDAIREKAKLLFEKIIQRLVDKFEYFWDLASSQEDIREQLTQVTRLLDSCAKQLYFGSGAFDQRKSDKEQLDVREQVKRKRFLREYLPSLRLLAKVSYPSVTHPILEIVEAMIDDDPESLLHLLFDAVKGGGTKGGYHFESLGADLIVKIARRFIADYPSLLADSPENRASLLVVLNIFADTGWAEAKKMVYELPEALR